MKCPACDGKGGEYEPILYKGLGGGPYYPCEFCDDEGHMGFFNWLLWYLFVDPFWRREI